MVFPTMFNVISGLLLNFKRQQTKMKSHVETNRGLKQPHLSVNAMCGIMRIIFNVSLGTEVTCGLCL